MFEGLRVELSEKPLDSSAVRGFVTGDPACGGLVFFEGATRAETDPNHGALVRLDYEVHRSMARKQLESLAQTAANRFSAKRVAISHRIGGVAVGEPSVMIGVACPHRGQAFNACRWIIDALKVDVPIWKKDVFEDGFVRWVEAANAELGMRNAEESEE